MRTAPPPSLLPPLLSLLFLTTPPAAATTAHRIKHVVVLMEENRAFDHFFGWGRRVGLKVDGLSGQEYNLANASDPTSQRIYVDDAAEYIKEPLCDPAHSTGATTWKVFGGPGSDVGPNRECSLSFLIV